MRLKHEPVSNDAQVEKPPANLYLSRSWLLKISRTFNTMISILESSTSLTGLRLIACLLYIPALHRLQSLGLSSNRISIIPPEISGVKNCLRSLDISNNRLSNSTKKALVKMLPNTKIEF